MKDDEGRDLFRRNIVPPGQLWRSEPKEEKMDSNNSQVIISGVTKTGSVHKGRVDM